MHSEYVPKTDSSKATRENVRLESYGLCLLARAGGEDKPCRGLFLDSRYAIHLQPDNTSDKLFPKIDSKEKCFKYETKAKNN